MKSLALLTTILLFITGCNQESSPPPTLTNTPIVATPISVTSVATPTVVAPLPRATVMVSITPTSVPTPIIYTVQTGDTILTIAARFNRSTTAIQTANGLIDPRQLVVGQQLIIPTENLFPDNQPTITPTPLPLTIQAVSFQPAGNQAIWCLGEVHNSNTQTVTEVMIETTLLDETGLVLARQTTFSQLTIIPPNRFSPFAMQFQNPPNEFAQYQIRAISGVPLNQSNQIYTTLKSASLQGRFIGASIYQITGILHNNGANDVKDIRLVGLAYSETNQLIAQRQIMLDVTILKTEAMTPFTLELMIPQGTVDHYQVMAEALQIE